MRQDDETPTWVRRAQNGDAAAFDSLLRRYQDRAVGYARSVLNGDRALAEDAAQEAFLLAYRYLDMVEEGLRSDGRI